MTNPSGRAEIEALLAERGRFETWLDQLAAKAATMPAHVVERVRADYQQRLDKVIGSLLSQADAMRSEATALDDRVRTLESDLALKRDARAEDELRAMVGEYSPEEWEKRAADHDAAIQALERERAEHETQHSRIKQLLDESVRPPRPPTPISTAAVEVPVAAVTHTIAEPTPPVTAAPAPVDAQPAAEPPAAAPSPPAAEEKAEPAPSPSVPKRPSPFDEIGFMRAVVGRTTPFGGVPLPADLPPEPPAPAPPKAETRAAPEPPPPPVAPPAPAAPTEAPVKVSGERKAVPTFEAPPIPDAPIVAPVRASSPAIPMITDESSMVDSMRNSASMPDAARTLKCQECGWMNYPTEWYCEKCGGELAAF